MSNFVPLHIKSGYSFLSSGLTIEKIRDSVKKENYIAAGLADFNVMYGVPHFIKEMEGLQKNWIIGIEIIVNGLNVIVYCVDDVSYHALCHISSHINDENFKLNDYLNENKHSLTAVLSTNNDAFKTLFKEETLARQLNDLSKLFAKFYIGIEIYSKEDNEFAKDVRAFANEHIYECVAFPEIKYQTKQDAIILDIVNAIRDEKIITDKTSEGQNYFMPLDFYSRIYTQKEIALTEEIAKSNQLNFHKKRGELLHYPVSDSKAYLKELVDNALKAKGLSENLDYISRAKDELEVIIEMGYADYFLIVQDYVSYAKSNNILVGPGRGSAAGSLVSYLLGITEIDPLEYNLQFERFLNKARKTMPDIDIDFMDIKRDDMVSYMREKYGIDRVANIVTFQTIGAKQSLRDIGRIYDYPTRHIDLLSKTLTNPKLSLRESYRTLPAFKSLVDSDKYFLEIVTLASKIEGLPRQSGLHAAGIILNNTSLENALPTNEDFSNNLISQYEMNYLEEQGFLKMDFLGLRNLTTIAYAVSLINKNHPELNLKADAIPYKDDPNIFNIISSGLTTGIFQLESAGMKRAISKIKPTCFEDVYLTISIFRPGPMDNIDDYVRRKKGLKPVSYLSKEMEDVLKETCGVLIYQEQVNKLAQVMAGFSLSEADVFRRAVSKKKKEVLESQKGAFISGMKKKGYQEKHAIALFDAIAKFANYGFNKSHAVGYSIIACRMAYLKYYYPLEFYAAILQIASGTKDAKFNEYISEMKMRGMSILLPDINHSSKVFEIAENGLLFPLSSIHGVNAIMINKILDERNENGLFTDFFDFVVRMYPHKIKQDHINTLINAGVFDNFGYSRSSLSAASLSALQFAELCFSESGQMMLSPTIMAKPLINEIEDDPLEKLDKEYKALGIMLSANPLQYKKDLIEKNNASSIASLNNEIKDLIEARDEGANIRNISVKATLVAIVKNIKTITTKKNGSSMAFLKVVDETGDAEVVLFPKVFAEIVTKLKTNEIYVFDGFYEQKEEDKNSFVANTVKLLEE